MTDEIIRADRAFLAAHLAYVLSTDIGPARSVRLGMAEYDAECAMLRARGLYEEAMAAMDERKRKRLAAMGTGTGETAAAREEMR